MTVNSVNNPLNEKSNVALSSVYAAIFLTAMKLIVGIYSGSLGILSEALHSGLDLLAAIMTFFAVKIAEKPPDEDHNFGHGKVENISALLETLLLLITCFWIVYEAISRLINPVPIRISIWLYIVIIISVIVDFSRSRLLFKAADKYNSEALRADALHFSTDIFSSGVVFVGLIFSYFGILIADSLSALVVAVIVIFICFRIGKKSIDILLDKAPKEQGKIVSQIVGQFPQVIDAHDIKIRNSGADTFINLNIHLDHKLSLEEAHSISHELEELIKSKIKRCTIHIHIEPDNE